MVDFTATKKELRHISRIVARVKIIAPDIDVMSLRMDIEACHSNGNNLRLELLADAETHDFMHDVWGIMRNINRQTGELENCFLPRYSQR